MQKILTAGMGTPVEILLAQKSDFYHFKVSTIELVDYYYICTIIIQFIEFILIQKD